MVLKKGFLKVIHLNGNSKYGDYVAFLLIKVIQELDKTNVVQIILDDATNDKAIG